MDGRRAFKDRRLRPVTKCGVCGKKFKTPQGLKAHESEHKGADNVKAIPRVKPKTTILKRKIQIAKKKKAEKKTTKIEFECPTCTQIFSDYFTSFRHIQDYHCVNSKGEEVLPTSPHIIRPKRIVSCILCMNRILSEPHVCLEPPKPVAKLNAKKDEPKTQFKCLGCDQTYSCVQLYDVHISGSHGDEVESLFFPNMEEFAVWKQEMELHGKVKYVVLNKSKLKQTYHCSFAPVHNTEKLTHFCPSSIIVQEFPKGIQVHFHKVHHSHTVKEYNLPEQFKKHSITMLLKNDGKYTYMGGNTDDNNLYFQFKSLMECIVLDAAKINITALKMLLDKALEMTSVLNNCNEDDENGATTFTLAQKNMSDDQITTALESAKNLQKYKRKGKIQNENDNKKAKIETDSDHEVNTVSDKAMVPKIEITTVEDLEIEKEAKALEIEIIKAKALEIQNKRAKIVELENKKAKLLEIENLKAKILENDNKKAKVHEIENKRGKRKSIEHKTEMKTKAEPIKDTGFKENILKKEVRQYPGKKAIGVNTGTPKAKQREPSIDSSPSSFNDSYKNFVDTNFKLVVGNSVKTARKKNPVSNSEGIVTPGITPTTINSKRKPVVKTKMGQFKPSLSPKLPEDKKETFPILKPTSNYIRRFGILKDIEYEVKEQENDCNILILKI